MNEPHRGYLELHDIFTFDSNTDLQLGYHASALQSFAIGDGYPQQIPYYVPTFPEPTCVSHYATVNASRTRAWKPGHACIWREHDVWDWNERSKKPVALRHGYFEKDPRTGQKFEWYRDAWWPFLKRFRERIVRGRGLRKRWMTFAAGIPNEVSFLRRRQTSRLMSYRSSRLLGQQPISRRTSSRHPTGMTCIRCSRRCVQEPVTCTTFAEDSPSRSAISHLMCKVYREWVSVPRLERMTYRLPY